MAKCSFEGCDRTVPEPGGARGFCAKHYASTIRRKPVRAELHRQQMTEKTQLVGFKAPLSLIERVRRAARALGINSSKWLRSAAEEKLEREAQPREPTK